MSSYGEQASGAERRNARAYPGQRYAGEYARKRGSRRFSHRISPKETPPGVQTAAIIAAAPGID